MSNGMLTKIIPRISLINFIKLIWAVVIIYLGLSFRVLPAGENVLDLFKKDYLSGNDHEIYSSSDLNLHNSVDSNLYVQYDFNNFCDENNTICKKLDFISDYEVFYKNYCLSWSIYIVWWIDKYLVLGKNIFKAFDIINIQKEKSTKRAWTRWNDVFINTNTITYDWEFKQLLWHEFGHIVDLYSIKWLSSKKDKNFTEFEKSTFAIDDPSLEFYKISWNGEKVRKSKSKPEDFCSWYGMYDPFEDFAECNNLYLNHNVVFKLFAKNSLVLKDKYNFVASIYGGKYLDKDAKMYVVAKQKLLTWRPWDTTKTMINN